MPKKAPPKKAIQKPSSTKPIRKITKDKKKQQQERQVQPQQDDNSVQQSQDDQSNDDEDNSGSNSQSGDQDDDQQQISSEVKVDPANYAIKSMKFRQRRGTKMTSLINRKKQEEDDPFWAEYGANYFGDLDAGDNDQQDYVQSSSGRDIFDSDFDQTQSQHEQQDDGKMKPQQIDQQQQKQRKKKLQLVNKIKNAPPPKIVKKATKPPPQQLGNRYIHQMFTQQQLLGQAAHTQYLNWLSYRKLISIQTVKKDYSKKKHHIDGSKIIYRDKINNKGQRQVTYQLADVEAPTINHLNQIWNQGN